jgi:AraC-like DNA-binding protein
MLQDHVEPAVSNAFVSEALAAAARQGCDTRPLLAAAGIDASRLGDPQVRVTPEAFGALWLAIARALDDEFFGLDSRRMKVGSFATLARLTMSAPNLRQVLVRVTQFFGILLDDVAVELQLSGAAAVIQIHERGPGPRDRVFAHETLLVLIHGLACWLIGRRIPILRADFAYPAPAWAGEYRSVYSENLHFDAALTRAAFSPLLLEAPPVQNERSLREFLRGAPGNFVLKYKDQNSLSSRVRRHLRDRDPTVWPGFDELAEVFHLGPTTLRRRLEREGNSFSAIKDALRRDMAIHHLANPQLSIGEIAARLGFAEPSAFHRAFKQWTGLRPGDYRGG